MAERYGWKPAEVAQMTLAEVTALVEPEIRRDLAETDAFVKKWAAAKAKTDGGGKNR